MLSVTDPSVIQFEHLQNLLRNMYIPELRRTDMGWLKRNLPVRNRAHPNFKEAMSLINHLSQRR